MKVLVCGSRNWSPRRLIARVLQDILLEYGDNLVVISGGCKGVDVCAQQVCASLEIDNMVCPAKWRTAKDGTKLKFMDRSAGPKRNQRMLKEEPDLVLVFHQDLGQSKGSRDMVDRTRKLKIEVVHYDHE